MFSVSTSPGKVLGNSQSTFAGKKRKRFRRKENTKMLTRIDVIREKTEIFEVLIQVNNDLWKMNLVDCGNYRPYVKS